VFLFLLSSRIFSFYFLLLLLHEILLGTQICDLSLRRHSFSAPTFVNCEDEEEEEKISREEEEKEVETRAQQHKK
jgi:hypothetical protein